MTRQDPKTSGTTEVDPKVNVNLSSVELCSLRWKVKPFNLILEFGLIVIPDLMLFCFVVGFTFFVYLNTSF